MLAEPTPELLAKWAEQQLAAQAVWQLIAQSQVAHLAERPRRGSREEQEEKGPGKADQEHPAKGWTT